MELRSVQKTFHRSHLGDEKHEMLSLNRRLETYLNHVKLLEEENARLAKEIQSLRHNNHRDVTRRKGLEDELQQARQEVDEAWRDSVHTELEVCRLTEEVQALNLQRQREAQAHLKAKTVLEQSRKELEEEQSAQIWLREKVNQLEHEMRLLIQTHQEDVAHLEATLTHSRATVPPALTQRGHQTPNLLQLGQEYSQRATRAWQEAAEAYQGQLARLEESLNQARSHLTQVTQDKSESQMKLQALQKEISSAQDIRLHLEMTAAQQRDRHSQEIQQLQDHLEDLEVEKEKLGQQTDHVLLENQGLLQLKISLGLEVATYRALLDSESFRGGVSLLNQPRNISITDVVFCPRGLKKNYQTHQKITSLSSACGVTGTGPTVITAKPVYSSKPISLNQIPKISKKTADETWETPYPKILQDGAVENFRPQEVYEKVTQAEPLSPPNEQEAPAITTPGDKEDEQKFDNVHVETPKESPVAESLVSYQLESGFSSEPIFKDEGSHHLYTTSSLTPELVRTTEKPCGLSDESEKEDLQEQPHAPTDAWVKSNSVAEEVEHVQEETSDSETEAVCEPTFASRTSSPASECEPEESVINQLTDFRQDDNIPNDGTVEREGQEISSSQVGTKETDVEDKLYPDGEEMDTWDSVIERKVNVETDDGITKDEEKGQHAEPEEDISGMEPVHEKRDISGIEPVHEKRDISGIEPVHEKRDISGIEPVHEERDVRQDFATEVQEDNVATAVMDSQEDDEDVQQVMSDQENALLSDKEEDSQNVSVSWRTEVESDSYAQENTLADTRPLIQYKSDETDANASHMDESESSEVEQEKKIGEMGTWSEGKSKRFGTMEDLCEEAEGEALDEEYDLGYTHPEDRDGHSPTTTVYAASMKDTENAEGMIKKVDEGHSDDETEEPSKPMVPTNVDYDEELETDRLVEQELENLCTDSYSAHFAQRQDSKRAGMMHPQGMSVERVTQQEEAGQTETEATFFCADPPLRVIIDHQYDNLYFSDSSATEPQTEKATDVPEKREFEDEQNVSMVTHADETEDGFNDVMRKPEMEEICNSKDPNSVQEVAAPTEEKEVVPVDVDVEHVVEGVADCQSVHDAAEAAEWEVLQNPSEGFEIRDETENGQKCGDGPESDEIYQHNENGSDEDIMTHKEESPEISPDSVPDEDQIFVVKDSAQLLDKSGKDNDLHDVFSSGIKNDFWVSSVGTGATYQADDTYNEVAEHTNQNVGFSDSLVWGTLENTNEVNRNSGVDIESNKALDAEEEQGQVHSVVKQVCRKDEGDFVHSEESEAEGESWSSGEEAV